MALTQWMGKVGFELMPLADYVLERIKQGERVFADETSLPTLARMGAYLVLDSAASVPPVVGWVVDTLFPGHLMAAGALQKHIEATHWVEDSEAAARASGDHERHLETVKNDRKLKRIVYLHD